MLTLPVQELELLGVAELLEELEELLGVAELEELELLGVAELLLELEELPELDDELELDEQFGTVTVPTSVALHNWSS